MGGSSRGTPSGSPVVMSAADAGRELYAVRPLPGPLVPFVYLGLLAVCFPLGLAAPEPGLWVGFLTLAVGAVFFGVLLVGGYLEKHRVCEHGLVLGVTLWGSRPFVIPWSTVSPETLVLHEPFLQLGVPTTSVLHLHATRMATYSRRAVSLVGLHPDLAHLRRRRRSPLGGAFAAVGGILVPAFCTRWALGVRDPEPLLRAIEAALVASGADAHGIAQRALDHPVRGPRAPGPPAA